MKNIEYTVEYYFNDEYRVIEMDKGEDFDDEFSWEQVFVGSLADCEAYIRLKQGGYMK